MFLQEDFFALVGVGADGLAVHTITNNRHTLANVKKPTGAFLIFCMN
jgi:hypothetical protein